MALGAAIAWSAIDDVNDDAKAFVAAASILGPLSAAVAAAVWSRTPSWVAGILLVASAVVTPTYFAWPFNAAVLIAGVALIVLRPHRSQMPGPRSRPTG